MAIVAIRPRKGSRKFNQEIIEEFYEKSESSTEAKFIESKPYEGERWDDTKVEKVPVYSWQKKRFTILDPNDLTGQTELSKSSPKESFEALNQLVTACQLKHPEDSPFRGTYITSANIYNPEDPFFTHDDVYITLTEGNAYIEDEIELNKIMVLVIKTHEDFGVGGQKLAEHLNSKVSYLIVDKDLDRKLKKKAMSKTKEAFAILEALTSANAVKVALALNLISDPLITDYDLVNELLFDYANNTIDTVRYGVTKQDYFLEVIALGSVVLDTAYLFALGKTKGVIQFKDGGYTAFGKMIGKTQDQCITVLTSPEMRPLFERIQEAVKIVKIEPPLHVDNQAEIKIPD